jgi:hypothetical protein
MIATRKHTQPRSRAALAVCLLAIAASLAVAAPAAAVSNPCFRCRTALGARFMATAAKAVALSAVCHRREGSKGETSACNDEIVELVNPCFSPRGQFFRLLDRVATTIGRRCPATEPILSEILVNYPNQNPLEIVDPRVYSGIVGPCMLTGLRAWGREVIGAANLSGQLTSLKCRNAAARASGQIVKRVVRAAARCQREIDSAATTFGGIDPGCYAAPPARMVERALARIDRMCAGEGVADYGGCTPLPGCVIEKSVEFAHQLAADTWLPTPSGGDRLECECTDGDKPIRCTTNAVCTNGGLAAGACEPLCASHGGVAVTSCAPAHPVCM